MKQRLLLLLTLIMVFTGIAFADEAVVDYDATQADTALKVDVANTDAVIDYGNQEVLLPLQPNPDMVKFIGEGYDYVIAQKSGTTRYSFDGAGIIANTVAPSVSVSDPVGLAVNSGTPDQIISVRRPDRKFDINYYGYDGSALVNVPSLTAAGLESSLSIAYIDGEYKVANLTKTSLDIMGSNGTALAIEQTIPVTNPFAVAAQNGYNIAVGTKDGINQYGYDGSSVVPIPALAVSFATEGKTVRSLRGVGINGNDVFALDATQVLGFAFDGANMKYSDALSVTTGLVRPKAFAIDPNDRNMVILDETTPGNFTARYFMHDTTAWIENTALNTVVSDLSSQMDYADSAEIVMLPVNAVAPGGEMLRVRAYTVVPENTKITFYTAIKTGVVNGKTVPLWEPSWEVRRDLGANETVWKYIPDGFGGHKWALYGTIDQSFPSFDRKPVSDAFDPDAVNGGSVVKKDADYLNDLWTEFGEKSTTGYFKAVLSTTDKAKTPKIVFPGVINPIPGQTDTKILQLQITPKPSGIIVDVDDGLSPSDELDFANFFGFPPKAGWVYTTTPDVNWKDAGSGLSVAGQTAYQMVILGVMPGNLRTVVLDTGRVNSNGSMTKVPTSYDPQIKGCLFNAGTFEFEALVRVWTAGSTPSDYSPVRGFKVLAMERPRISGLVDPPESYVIDPVESLPGTHAIIRPAVSAVALPEFKAGAEVTLTVDTVGPISRNPGGVKKVGTFILKLPNGTLHATHYIAETNLNALAVNVPNNELTFKLYTDAPETDSPSGSVLSGTMVSEGYDGIGTFLKTPGYAEGFGAVAGTNYENWRVLMNGSKND